MNRDPFHDVILSTKTLKSYYIGAFLSTIWFCEYLRDLRIKKCHKGEGSEGLRDEHVSDLPEFGEVVPQVFCRHVLGAAADEHLAGDLLYLTLLCRGKEKLVALLDDFM